MEMENRYASKGVGGTALGLSIGALGVELLRGGLGGIVGGCDGHNREFELQANIARLETEVKLRDANTYTMSEVNKLRDYVDRRFDGVHAEISAQAVYNATNTATLNCIGGQVSELMALTKRVVPNSSICPGWSTTTTTG